MSLKQKTVKGVIWSAVERFSTQGVQFLFGIVLARMLTPADYGIIAMLTIFLAVSQTFIDSGFGNAIIRKTDRNEKDMATMFYFNIGMSLICYVAIFCIAPLISVFYEMPELTLILRVLALKLIFQSFSVIQITQLTISINFKKQAKISLTSAIVSGIVGIFFAMRGYGVWSLVIQTLFSSVFSSCLYWIIVRWHPVCFFSKESFKYLFGFGSKLLASSLINTLYNNIYPLVIGKFYSAAQLGSYAKAEKFASFPSSNITGILQRVSFPVLSKMQGEHERLRTNYLKFINYSSLLIFPLMMGLAALAKPLTLLFLTEKWSGMIFLLQLLCFSMMWHPVHAINLNILQVMGRSDLFLKLEIIKKIIGIIILCVTIPLGLVAMCVGQIVSAWISLFINSYYSGKFLDAGINKQLKFCIPIFLNSIVMGALCMGVTMLLPEKEYAIQLILGIPVGATYYLLSNWLFNRKIMSEMLNLLKQKNKD